MSPLSSMQACSLATLDTPFLALDRGRMERNIERLRTRMSTLGVTLRPHLKTVKSVDAARLAMDSPAGPATVSTLREAEVFAAAGITDMTYAVGIAPGKLDRVMALLKAGVNMKVVLDTPEQAVAVSAKSRENAVRIPALIEIDCDNHRGGLLPDDPALGEIARILDRDGAELRGVLVHAGDSYFCRSREELVAAAENERRVASGSAAALRAAGFACPVVSVGSTPTAHFAENLDGVTEVRAGVFMLFDLVMAGIGVCALDDIALSVVATVIGHRRDKGAIFIDAGWMALSRDRGTARQAVDQGYGLVCSLDGHPIPDLIVSDASQEHGIVSVRRGSHAALPDLAIGSRVRILPNHACAAAAQHDFYAVVAQAEGPVIETWPRFRGW